MIECRPFNQLAEADRDWLRAKQHFSFADHHDATRMGSGSLRVWNDDEIAPNVGFPAHPHANAEITTCVRADVLTHKDSLGNRGAAAWAKPHPLEDCGDTPTNFNSVVRQMGTETSGE